MDSVGHLLSFLMPTHKHVSGNHNNGYGHLKTVDMQSSADCRKSDSSTVSNLAEIMIFNIAV
jgi:hypothetical protein